MKTSEIRFYDRYTRTQVLYREDEYGRPFLPVTTRPRGGRYGTGNRTIGGYVSYRVAGCPSTTRDNQWVGRWVWTWVDPRNVNETMEHFFDAQDRAAEAARQLKEQDIARQRATLARFKAAGVPAKEVYRILGIDGEYDAYKRKELLKGHRSHLHLNADQIIALIESHPMVKAAKQQAEVDEALRLLGSVG